MMRSGRGVAVACAALVMVIAAPVSAGAEEELRGRREYDVRQERAQVLEGTVKSVVPADLQRINPALIMADEGGNEVEFKLRPSCVAFSAATGKIMSLKELVPGTKVRVSFETMRSGSLRASVIKVMETPPPPAAVLPAEEGK